MVSSRSHRKFDESGGRVRKTYERASLPEGMREAQALLEGSTGMRGHIGLRIYAQVRVNRWCRPCVGRLPFQSGTILSKTDRFKQNTAPKPKINQIEDLQPPTFKNDKTMVPQINKKPCENRMCWNCKPSQPEGIFLCVNGRKLGGSAPWCPVLSSSVAWGSYEILAISTMCAAETEGVFSLRALHFSKYLVTPPPQI